MDIPKDDSVLEKISCIFQKEISDQKKEHQEEMKEHKKELIE